MKTEIETIAEDEELDFVENIVESDLSSLGESDEDQGEGEEVSIEEAKKKIAEEDDVETADAEKGDSGKSKKATADAPVPEPEAEVEIKPVVEKKVDPKDVDGEDDDDESDDGEGMDAVGDEDEDIDNDGDSDDTDKYLLARRKKVTKAIADQEKAESKTKKESVHAGEEDEEEQAESKTKKEYADDEEEEQAESKTKKESADIDFSNIKRLVEEEEGLTDEFRGKAALIFEAELRSKIDAETDRLKEEFEIQLAEETEKVNETLVNQIDSYITYVAEEWMEENKVAVESGLRTELAESFMSALKGLFTEHYIEVPESKVDLYAKLEAESAELQENLEKAQLTVETLSEKVVELSKDAIIEEVSRDLSQTERAKLEKLAEAVDFEDEVQFEEKVSTLKEFYFGAGEEVLVEDVEEDSNVEISTETIVEEGVQEEPELPRDMQNYLSAISRQGRIASQQGGV